MKEALMITLPMALGGSCVSYLLYKLVHKFDKVEVKKERSKRVLYKTKRPPLKLACSHEISSILKSKIIQH